MTRDRRTGTASAHSRRGRRRTQARVGRLLGLLAMLLVTPALVLAGSPTAAAADDRTQRISSYVEDALDRYDIPGASLVMLEHGVPTTGLAWGTTADGRPVTTQTPFLLGSLSKPLTALGVMLLVQDGRLDLETPVEQILPDFRYEAPDGASISIRHLLRQTSGISAADSLVVTDRKYSASGALADAVDALSGVRLAAPPGEAYRYASANYLLLGAVIEAVDGQPFADYMEERVFAPLGMTRTSADWERAQASGYDTGHASWFGRAVPGSFYDHAGAPYGYMTSTAEDLGRFLAAMQGGGGPASEQTREALSAPPEDGRSYGTGWHWNAEEGFPFHGGATPHARAEMFFDPGGDTAAVLLTNKYHTLEDGQVAAIMAGLRALEAGAEPAALPSPPAAPWILLGIVLAAAGGLAVSIRRSLRLRPRQPRIRLRLSLAGGLLAAGGGLIPLICALTGTPWHSLRWFAPDLALLFGCLAAILVAWGAVLALTVRRVPRRRREVAASA